MSADNKIYYTVFRCVPDQGRGEFVNVGVAVVSKNGEWAARWTNDFTKLKALDPELDTDVIAKFIEREENQVEVRGGMTLEYLQKEATCQANFLVCVPPLPTGYDSVDDAVEKIYQRMVA
jgi:hypothetical protein